MKKMIRLTESDLKKVIRRVVNENIVSDSVLQVEPRRYGEFWVRDTNTWLEFNVSAWIDKGILEGTVTAISDDRRAEQMENSGVFLKMCLSAILDEEPQNIDGFDKYIEEETEDGWNDYETALDALKLQLNVTADTLEKYNKRIADAIDLSDGADDFSYDMSMNVKPTRSRKSIQESFNNRKKRVHLTESDLHRIVKESVKSVLKNTF